MPGVQSSFGLLGNLSASREDTGTGEQKQTSHLHVLTHKISLSTSYMPDSPASMGAEGGAMYKSQHQAVFNGNRTRGFRATAAGLDRSESWLLLVSCVNLESHLTCMIIRLICNSETV